MWVNYPLGEEFRGEISGEKYSWVKYSEVIFPLGKFILDELFFCFIATAFIFHLFNGLKPYYTEKYLTL